jgi:hypothetical protein
MLKKTSRRGAEARERVMARKWVNGEEVLIHYKTGDGREFSDESDARKHQDLIDDLSQNFSSYLDNAQKGNSAAQFNVGQCYFLGCGVEKDMKSAFYWYSKAAENGSANAKEKIKIYEMAGTGSKIKHTFPNGDVYEGYVYSNERVGVGKYTCKRDGYVYEGDYFNSLQHGKGKLTYANGTVYEGDWVDGEFIGTTLPPNFTGKGKLTDKEGNTYEGDIVNGKPNGKGKMTYTIYENGAVYEGDWKDGEPNGKGKMTWGDGSYYEGDHVNDKWHGYGKYVNKKEGEVYEGEWKESRKHGKGKLTVADGRVDEGEWENGEFAGVSSTPSPKPTKGKLNINGGVYEGDIVNGEPYGKGKIIYDDGGFYEGDWKEGMKHGKGKMIFDDGLIYEGDWKYGQMSGKGKRTYPDGKVEEGRFGDYGEFLG